MTEDEKFISEIEEFKDPVTEGEEPEELMSDEDY